MDEKLKQKWIKALRSGKYKQVKESLKAEIWDQDGMVVPGVGYCCLGVLCEIAPGIKWEGSHYVITQKKLAKLFANETDEDNEGWDAYEWAQDPKDRDVRHPVIESGIEISGEALPVSLYKHFGMDKKVRYNNETVDIHGKLIRMNDNGKTFKQIADYIEKVL